MVPGTNLIFSIERPSFDHPSVPKTDELAQYYDLTLAEDNNPNTTPNTPVYAIYDSVFCAGHLYTPNGDLVLYGGNPELFKCRTNNCEFYVDGRSAIRVANRQDPTQVTYVSTLARPRWYPSLIMLPDGTLMAVGGTTNVDSMPGYAINPNYELWKQAAPGKFQAAPTLFQLPLDFVQKTRGFWYPFVTLLPTGHALIYGDQEGIIIEPQTGTVVSTLPALPNTPGFATASRTYPYHAPGRLLPIVLPQDMTAGADLPTTYIDFILWGGQKTWSGPDEMALDTAVKLRINFMRTGTNAFAYTYNNWEVERMPGPRYQHNGINLPNGKWILIGGAAAGFQGDSGLGNNPVVNAWEYDPNQTLTQRYRVLAASRIIRMYHNNACLIPDGRVLEFGSDRNDVSKIKLGNILPTDIDPSPYGDADYRIEAFAPQDWFRVKPVIQPLTKTVYAYSELLTLTYTLPNTAPAGLSVIRVTLHAPCSSTHGTDMGQRTLVLPIKTNTPNANNGWGLGTLSVMLPPNARYAPPGYYLLFITMTDNSYSRGVWVQVGV
eukprot:GDKI01006098.1.p1 GENE.GDKI01006098.1~~GDKI01006098.1.p1  ORF type:complete len:548 (+),score=126.49 GDKI01006098.1:972-2615(+)